jgi:hypothetical protein
MVYSTRSTANPDIPNHLSFRQPPSTGPGYDLL